MVPYYYILRQEDACDINFKFPLSARPYYNQLQTQPNIFQEIYRVHFTSVYLMLLVMPS